MEIGPPEVSGSVVRGGGSRKTQEVIETASPAFDKVLVKLKPMYAAIVHQIRDSVEQPEEVNVELGLG